MKINGALIFKWAKILFPMHRSITGSGTLKTLIFLRDNLNLFKIHKIKTGTKVFDWKVPKVWEIKDAYIKDKKGKKIVDYKNNNLHIVGYSTPFKGKLSGTELQKNLYSIPNQKNAIPFITSYYQKKWGFCLSENSRKKIKKNEKYEILINSKFKDGYLNFGELYKKGKTKSEIIFSTNICHPSLGNNELSGILIATALSKYLEKIKCFYSYRIVFVPETIGALCFLKKNKSNLKRVKAGFVLSCLGDNKNFSLLHSPYRNNLADKVSKFNYEYNKYKYKSFSYLKRGSDERQYCAPKFNLPFCTLMRTRFGDYKEYHTSLDNLEFITAKALENSFQMIVSLIKILENNKKYISNVHGEPFLTKYNLKNEISGFNRPLKKDTKTILDLVAYSNGKNDLIDISRYLNKDFNYLSQIANKLEKLKIIKSIK